MKGKRGRGSWEADKPPIAILIERGGPERYVPSMDMEDETVGRIALRHVEQGSRIYTDGFLSYTIPPSLGVYLSLFQFQRATSQLQSLQRLRLMGACPIIACLLAVPYALPCVKGGVGAHRMSDRQEGPLN